MANEIHVNYASGNTLYAVVRNMGIGICSVLGGVYGTKAIRFLKDAKGKSNALKEIITGNELFKKQNQSQAAAFKQAHQNQSPQTRHLVAAIKS